MINNQAETAMTAEQFADQLENTLHDLAGTTFDLLMHEAIKHKFEQCAAHVREAAQGEIDLQPLKDVCERQWAKETPRQVIAIAANAIYWRGENIKEYAARFVQANERAETAERKLAELEKEYEHALSCMDRSCKRCGAALCFSATKSNISQSQKSWRRSPVPKPVEESAAPPKPRQGEKHEHLREV